MYSYIYYFYHHFNPNFPKDELFDVIEEHNWEKFNAIYQQWKGKYVDSMGRDDMVYMPDSIFVYSDTKDCFYVPLTEKNFMKLNASDCECG